MWLFEGATQKGVNWVDGNPHSLDQEYLDNLKEFILIAKAEGVELNLTLFDGNMTWGWNKMPKNLQDRWWNIFNAKYDVLNRFMQTIYKQLLDMLLEDGLYTTVTQIDFVNEIDALVWAIAGGSRFENGWHSANKFTCDLYNYSKSHPVGSKIMFTSSVGWLTAPYDLVSANFYPHCVDFFDLHVYSDSGNIPFCKSLKQLRDGHKKPLQLGEFGQMSKKYDDRIQIDGLRNSVKNALRCGFSSALAWRLVDHRKGEDRFNYDGRGSYYIFRQLAYEHGFNPSQIQEPATK